MNRAEILNELEIEREFLKDQLEALDPGEERADINKRYMENSKNLAEAYKESDRIVEKFAKEVLQQAALQELTEREVEKLSSVISQEYKKKKRQPHKIFTIEKPVAATTGSDDSGMERLKNLMNKNLEENGQEIALNYAKG